MNPSRDIRAAIAFDHADFVLALKIKPELRAVSEIAAQAHGCVGRDRAPAIQNVCDRFLILRANSGLLHGTLHVLQGDSTAKYLRDIDAARRTDWLLLCWRGLLWLRGLWNITWSLGRRVLLICWWSVRVLPNISLKNSNLFHDLINL